MNVNGFYRIEKFSFNGEAISASLVLEPNHWICDVHFPGSPIMPGAMVVNTVQQLVSKAFEKQYMIDRLSNVKFMRPIIPNRDSKLLFNLTLTMETGENISNPALLVKCSVSADKSDVEFVKLTAHLIFSP